jgi:hypothetical protein
MSRDLTLEIAHIRNVLRRSVAAGLCTAEAHQALERMQEISFAGDPLDYECRRWRTQLGLLRQA